MSGPLAGLRVVDFSWVVVGNVTTKLLGDFGAEVIKIEGWQRRSGERSRPIIPTEDPTSPDNKHWFAHIASSKKSVTANLKTEEGRKIVFDLIRDADVVMENFSPGTIERMGFGYEALKAINPGIIMASGSIFGQTGPLARLPGVDATGAARAGRIDASGYPDGPPLIPSHLYGDSLLPFFIASAMLAALRERDRTGKGCRIDGSMQEVIAHQMWPLIDRVLQGDQACWRTGNRHPDTAPHNVYPAAGEDRWIAIEVWSDAEWAALCTALGQPELAHDARFATLAARKANEDALDAMIGDLTRPHDARALMAQLQEQGVAAGAVQTNSDIVERDPQLRERGFLTDLHHPVLGDFGHQRSPITLERADSQVMFRAPLLGEHNRSVCKDILGMSDAEIDALEAAGTFR